MRASSYHHFFLPRGPRATHSSCFHSTIYTQPQNSQCILLYYTGFLPFVRLDSDILGIPIDHVDYARVREQKALKALPDAVCWVLAFILGGKPPLALIPPGLFKHLRARGIPIFFLGVNDEEDLKVREAGGGIAWKSCIHVPFLRESIKRFSMCIVCSLCMTFFSIFFFCHFPPSSYRWLSGRDRPPC